MTKALIGLNPAVEKTLTLAPSLTMSAKLWNTERVPRVTTKNEILKYETSVPLIAPRRAPNRTATTTASGAGIPASNSSPSTIAEAAVALATERSTAPEMTT